MKYILKIESLNDTGQGIAKIDNKVTFIPKTIPEDEVEIEITKEHKKYNEAKKLKLIKKSNDRITYNCPYYEKCGGCNIANLSYDLQLEYKKNKVINIFKKYNKIVINPLIVPSENKYNYRNKITLQVQNKSLGLYEEKSNNIINLDKCLLVSDKINEIITILKTINLSKLKNIIIREIDNQIMIKFIGNILVKNIPNSIIEKSSSIYINDICISKEKELIQSIDKYKFIISPDSFFQININQTINLYNQILEYANPTKNDKVLDLFCGTGTIGIYLANHCKEVLGIELSKSSIDNANSNKKLNKTNNINFQRLDLTKVNNIDYKPNIVVVDPPRSGLDKKMIKVIEDMTPTKIIYVSCDPITLSRDIKLLNNNYELKEMKLFDMFPQTYHVECVCILNRR